MYGLLPPQAKFLQGAYQRHASPGGKLRTVLELGCGPANHATQLAKRGVQAWALDSNPHMLQYAAKKAAAAGVTNLQPVQGDMTQFNIKVCACVCVQPENTSGDPMPQCVCHMCRVSTHGPSLVTLCLAVWLSPHTHTCPGYGGQAGHGGVHVGHAVAHAGQQTDSSRIQAGSQAFTAWRPAAA